MNLYIYPQNLDIEQLGLTKIERKSIKKLVAILFNKTIYKDNPNNIVLNSVKLQVALRDYRKYLTVLEEHGVIRLVKEYSAGHHSRTYTFTPEYWHPNLVFEPIKSKRSMKQSDIPPEYRPCRSFFNDLLQIDVEYALRITSQNMSERQKISKEELNDYKTLSVILINKIHHGDYYFKIDKNGRLHTNLTNLPSELRKCITYGGNRVVGIDISNTQPLLLIMLCKNEKSLIEILNEVRCPFENQEQLIERIKKNPYDLARYEQAVTAGKFYEILGRKYCDKSGVDLGRETIKTAFLTIINGERWHFNRTSRKIYKVFCGEFPTIASLLNILKTKSHKNVSTILQRFESRIVIKDIANQFIAENPRIPLFTIHDCWYTYESHLEIIEEMVRAYFQNKYEIEVPLKVERYGTMPQGDALVAQMTLDTFNIS